MVYSSYPSARIVAPYVREGMTVLEPGPGMGFFTLEIARRVAPSGRVIAVDIQPEMLERLKRRAEAAGVLAQVDARLSTADSMDLSGMAVSVDFTLVFAVLHEMPSARRFSSEAASVSRPGATLLLVEPKGHVKAAAFEEEIQAAAQAGYTALGRPSIRWNHAAHLKIGK